MTFLNPLLLFGLFAAAIPVLIHLFNLRKLRTIQFSSLLFLKELQKTRMRRVKLRQWLLLLLRTLLIVLLVLGFARPALEGSVIGISGPRAATSMVVLLDDSPSMGARSERGLLFSRAKDAVDQISGVLKEGDEVYLLPLSHIRRQRQATTLRSAQALTNAVEQLQPSFETVPFADALAEAARILGHASNINREIYLISDCQASQFTAAPLMAEDSLAILDGTINLYVLELGSPGENVGLLATSIPSSIISPGNPVRLRSQVGNFGSQTLPQLLMNVYLDGKRTVQHTLGTPAGITEDVEISIIPRRRGEIPGYVQLDDDALDVDNRRYFIVHVPKQIRVLLIGHDPDETRFPALALAAGDSAGGALLSITRVTASQFSSVDVNKFDVVFLCGVRSFTSTDRERLTRFLDGGGGVVVFPGDQSDLTSYNTVLLGRLSIPPIAAGTSTSVGPASSFVAFDKVDFDHPLFAGLFETTAEGKHANRVIESPHVVRYVMVKPGLNGRAIVTLSDGSPFLTEYLLRSGRVLFYSVAANLSWSDFPIKGIFLPLVHRSAVYASAGTHGDRAYIVGEHLSVTARLPGNLTGSTLVFRSPSGIDERVVPRSLRNGLTSFESATTSEPGIYDLRLLGTTQSAAGETLRSLAVNIDPSESDLRHATPEERETLFGNMGFLPERIHAIASSGPLAATIQESRFGVELWKPCLLIAALLALAEMLLGRVAKRDQSIS